MAAISRDTIQDKIDKILAAIDVVLTGGQFYSLSDGQGSVQVTNTSLANLNKAMEYWLTLCDSLYPDESSNRGRITSLVVGGGSELC